MSGQSENPVENDAEPSSSQETKLGIFRSHESSIEESSAAKSSAEEALEFLEQLDARHNEVLNQLDELNDKIEEVLESYLSRRLGNQGEKSQEAEQQDAA